MQVRNNGHDITSQAIGTLSSPFEHPVQRGHGNTAYPRVLGHAYSLDQRLSG
jgi:hypothetical protein